MSAPQGVHDFVVDDDPTQVDNNQVYKAGSGLKALLKASYPDAVHKPLTHPTQCYSGIRQQHMQDITGWAWTFASERHFKVMWLRGPAGSGTSALAQSCAKEVGEKLAAAFFFSRPNTRDDPARLFTSIAYQLSMKYPLYRDKLDVKVYQDRSLLQKSIEVQFRELIVAPLQELQKEGRGVTEGIIFIDGFDECDGGDAQCTIIDVITTSVRDQTTPFIWAFFSRPEPLIVAQFSAPHIYPLCWQLVLPVSRDANGEIKLYLRSAFESICTQYNVHLAVKWPTDGDLQELVDRSAGLFIYPTSIVRYLSKGDTLRFEERLQQVLRHPGKSPGNSWTHLDAFYTLIMEQVPKEVLPNTSKLLLSFQVVEPQFPPIAAAILGFSMSAFLAALGGLHSVIRLTRSDDGLPLEISFYHTSFVDFLMNPERSENFYLKTPERCATVLAKVVSFFDNGVDKVVVPWNDSRLASGVERRLESAAFDMFWRLGSHAAFDEILLRQLSEFDFRKILYGWKIHQEDAERFFSNIPVIWRKQIIRPYSSLLSRKLLRENKQVGFPLVLGKNSRKIIIENVGHTHVIDYEDFRQIERYNLIWRNLIWRPLRYLIHRIDTLGEIEQY